MCVVFILFLTVSFKSTHAQFGQRPRTEPRGLRLPNGENPKRKIESANRVGSSDVLGSMVNFLKHPHRISARINSRSRRGLQNHHAGKLVRNRRATCALVSKSDKANT